MTGDRPAGSAAGSPADVSRRRATLDVIVQIAGQVGNVALGVVVTLLIVRGLGPGRFGEWSTILAVVGLLGYLVDLRLESVAVRHVAAQPEREADWIGALLTLSLAIAVPVTLGGAAVLAALSTDTNVDVRFNFTRQMMCEARARVAWANEFNPRDTLSFPYGMGLQFSETSDERQR